MPSERPPSVIEASEQALLRAQLAAWMAVQATQDRYARIAEGGASSGVRLTLASIFIELRASAPTLVSLPEPGRSAMSLLLGDPAQLANALIVSYADRPQQARWLLVGGPGSGKSTLTTMFAQQLRRVWVEGANPTLPEGLQKDWGSARSELADLAARKEWEVPQGVLPLRLSLPHLARWMASRNDESSASLWNYLAARCADDLAHCDLPCDLTSATLRGLVEEAQSIAWILDGLDEVPAAAGRARVLQVVRTTVCDGARPRDRIVVSTRPQGYAGELDDLMGVELQPLTEAVALEYAEGLLNAWFSDRAGLELADLREKLRSELKKPEVVELIQTPLHTTMAAILVADRGSLPAARSLLFDHYFDTIFRRELGKPYEHGIQQEDQNVLLTLHERAGATLHVRSQAQMGARSSLRRRELREMLIAIYAELGREGDAGHAEVERMMRFATERLVLLLHASEGEYEFGVRSLQEFFAARALMDGERPVVRGRLEAIATDFHWANVLAFVASSCALATGSTAISRALHLTAELCASLNSGEVGGEAARRCVMGSRLAVQMLRETQRYGHPWLHELLWKVAVEAALSETQNTIADAALGGHGRSGAWLGRLEVHTQLGLLAATWEGPDAARHRRAVVEFAKQQFAQGSAAQVNGWRLLYGLLVIEDVDAIQLANLNAPKVEALAVDVVRALCREDFLPAPAWASTFIEEYRDWFSPGSLGLVYSNPDAGPALVVRMGVQLRQEIHSARIELTSGDEVVVFAFHLMSIERDVPAWTSFALEAPEATPRWVLWKRIAHFLSAPSKDSLAEVLQAAAADGSYSEIEAGVWGLPWPIEACLAHARTPAALSSLADDMRSGRFGDTEDWRAAEARWRSDGRCTHDDWSAWVESVGPWNEDIGKRGVVPASWFTGFVRHTEAARWTSSLLDQIDRHPERTQKVLRLIGRLAVLAGDVAVPLRAVILAQSSGAIGAWWLGSLLFLLPDLGGPDAEGWFALLDERGRKGAYHARISVTSSGRFERLHAVACALIERLRRHPDEWGLLNVLASTLALVPDVDLSGLVLPDLPEDAPPPAFATRALLTLLSGRYGESELPGLLERLGSVNQGEVLVPAIVLAEVLQGRQNPDGRSETLLLAALDAQPPFAGEVRDALLGALFAVHQKSITASFASAEAWEKHELPRPFLALVPPAPPARILRIAELSHVRLFRETPLVDVPFAQPSGDNGQWIVIVGENGVGKTTLLRTIALVLASPAVASKLLDERLPMIRNGAEGRIAIEIGTGILDVTLKRGERTEQVEAATPPGMVRPWVVGYGVRRGNARGEKDREAEVGPIGELHTLFDRPASLHNAVQWLKDLDADVLREQRKTPRGSNAPPGPREGVWRAVEQALRALLGVTKVEVDEGGLVFVEHPQFDRVRLDALSDGYLTTAGWVIDMIARWIDRQYELDELVGADVLRRMTGFVLLDEIDLHLHPMWQMRIIEDVRRLFPRLSFVVTTHNPLTLQGARPGEVYVMRRDEARIELTQRDVRPGHDVDRVLFEQFGVAHTFDRKTRDLLDRHRALLERGASANDPERTDVEARLSEVFGSVGAQLHTERDSQLGPVPALQPEERSLMTPFLKRKG